MKKLSIAIVAMGLALSANAQVADYNVKVGDTVRIDTAATHYLTGEKMSAWVYGVNHTILQIGCKRFEEGILLGDILSWVSPEAVGAKKVEAEPAKEEPAPAVEEPAPMPEPVEEEPAPAVEEPKVEEPAWQEEEIAAQEAPAEPAEKSYGEPVLAQHRLSLGLRLGAASFLPAYGDQVELNNLKRSLGGLAALDVEYTYLWKGFRRAPRLQLGITTGVSLPYAHNRISAEAIATAYDVTDCENRPMHYDIAASNLKEVNSALLVQVPLLFALRHDCGFLFAVGPKFSVPVYSWYTLSYNQAHIAALYTQMGVTMRDNQLTGRLAEDEMAPVENKKLDNAKFHLLLDVELGYEWKLKNDDALALRAFCDAPLYSLYSNSWTNETNFVQVVPQKGKATMMSQSVTNCYANSFSYLDFGLKLSYTFCWSKK